MIVEWFALNSRLVVMVGDVIVSGSACCCATESLDALTSGLRALNDAPTPRRRIWVNQYTGGTNLAYQDAATAKYIADLSHDPDILRVAVPFVEEKP